MRKYFYWAAPLFWAAPVLLAGMTWTAAAQDGASGQSSKGAVIKGRAPVNSEVLQVTFPRPVETKLSNGLTVLVMEDHRLPSVLLQLQIYNGAFRDPAEIPGLSSFTADLLKEGAGGRSSLEIAQNLEDMGAEFWGQSRFARNVTDLGVQGLSEHTEGLVAQFADLVLNPTFTDAEIEKYRSRKLASLQQARSQSSYLNKERFMGALYGGHPARVTTPTEASLERFTRDDLVAYHQTYYVPGSSVLAVTGDVTVAQMTALLEKSFGSWKTTQAEPLTLPSVVPITGRKVLLVNRPDSVQTNLRMGNVGIARTDPDHVAVAVMNKVLGSGSSSRLFLKIREELGYTYGAYSYFFEDIYPGPWGALADVRTEVTMPSIDAFIEQIALMRNQPVPEKELEDAKRGTVARFALSLVESDSLTAKALSLKRFDLPADYWDKLPLAIQAVTTEDVQRVARKYLDPENMVIVAVGNGEAIRGGLTQFGEVLEYDVDGNLIRP